MIGRFVRRLLCRLLYHRWRWERHPGRSSSLRCGRCGIRQPDGLAWLCRCLVSGRYPLHGPDAYYPGGRRK